MDSILTSIKKLLGIAEENTDFDTDITIHINSAFSILTQLGVGPVNGFSIADEDTIWDDYIGNDHRLEMVKSYVYMKVRLAFDPPTSGISMDAMKQMVSEYEWRLNVAAETNQNGGK